jgi:tetratricopeptide (TPR) repeat protein
VPVTLSDPERDQRVRRMLDHFAVDPADTPTFEALEEHLFLAGAWSRLAGVYEARISVLAPRDPQRAEVLLRLAELLAERLRDAPGARRRYEELLRSHPQNRRGLAGLRQLYTACGERSAALQIGELEEALAQAPEERAALLAQTGQLWLELGVPDEARRRLSEAVELDPSSDAAARSFAELAAREGRTAEAVALYERRLKRLAGAARADALEQLARLLGPDARERQRALLHEVVRGFPQRRSALERLIELEREPGGDVARVDELQRALWRCLREPVERAQLALEAGTFQLDEAHDLEAALFWAQSGHSAAPTDVRVQELRARVHRRAGQSEPLLDALERLAALAPPDPTRMLELGALHARAGRPERAVEWLSRVQAEKPGDPEALALLDAALGRLGRAQERALVLEQRIARALDDGEAAELLGALGELCAGEIHDEPAAEHAWRRALERAPDHEPAALQLAQLLRKQERRPELAQLLAGRAGRAAGSRAAALYCELGRLQLEAPADLTAARTAFSAALDADPRSPDALLGLRDLAAAGGDAALALEACERELSTDPEPERSGALLAELVELAQRVGDLPRARRAARRWTDLDPTPSAWSALADTARAAGDAQAEVEALEQLEVLLGADREARARIRVRLGDVVLERSETDALERAAEHYAAALELRPSPELRARLADLYRRSGQLPELAEILRAQIAASPTDEVPGLRLELARALAELGDADGAIEELRPAFAARPGDAAISGLLEALLGEQDRVAELVEVLEQRLARERDPGRRRELARHQAGLLIDGLDRPADAVTVLRELADPSRDEPLERLFGEALAAAGSEAERERWLAMRESHVEGPTRIALLLELARLQERAGRAHAAIASLQRAQRAADPPQAEGVRAALLELLHRHGTPAQQCEFLDGAILSASEPAARTSLLLERARLRLDELGDPERALADLDEAQRQLPLGAGELRVAAALAARAASPLRRAGALERLIEIAPEPHERRSAALELAELRARGPAEVLDPAAAERILRAQLEREPTDRESFERLAELCSSPGRESDLIALLHARLERAEVRGAERAALAKRQAAALLGQHRAREAAAVLRAARAAGAPDAPLDELLDHALAATGDHAARAELCRERALAEDGPERARWLRRWLGCLERGGQPASERLEALSALLSQQPGSLDLIEPQIGLLRECGTPSELARALEDGIAAAVPANTRRRVWLRELLDLCEGPLASPQRAMVALERETDLAPELRERAARLAAHSGDAQRERQMLERLVAAAPAPAPALLRQLGLARARCGAGAEAEPLLWAAFERDPRDCALQDALEVLVRSRGDRAGLLRVLEARCELAPDAEQARRARELWQLAEQLGLRERGLGWLRRACALGEPDASDLRAWLALELELGDRLHALGVIELLLAAVGAAPERAGLLAQQAELLEARGQLEAALASLREAEALQAEPPLAWLHALERLCERLGRSAERAHWLGRLAGCDELGAAERERCSAERVALLAAHPELHAEAARALAELLEHGAPLSDPQQAARARQLLGLYDRLGRDAEWCALALRLAPGLDPTERRELERERARRLSQRLAAGEQAIEAWEAQRGADPDDPEVLDTLIALRRRPGDEAARAELLEQRARSAGAGAEQLWLEAAELRWSALGDGSGALASVERALGLAPGLAAAHALRSRLCSALERPEAEAESLRTLLAAEPDGPAAADRWLRLAQLAAGQPGREAEASQAARRALERATDPELRREIRRVFERCCAFAEAAALLREEVEAPEAPVESLRALARIEWDDLGHAREADGVLERLAARAPLELAERERWAAVREALGDRAGAVEQRRRALELARDAAGAPQWLALASDLLALGDASGALEATGRAISAEPRNLEALELRARIHRELRRPAAELDDCSMLAELLPDGPQRAAAWARAGEIASAELRDDARAWLLFRSALRACSTWLPALLGAGRIAARRSEWAEAERLLALACERLPGSEHAAQLPEVARSAARAAEARGRLGEACRYLERALEAAPGESEALDALAGLCLRLGAHARALDCLEARLAQGGLDAASRAERLIKLAQAAEGTGALARAARAVEQALELRPGDEVWRARAVDLLERAGETSGAIAQLEAWSRIAPAEDAPRLSMRAAQLELRSGQREAAHARLSALVAAPQAPAAAWPALAELVLGDRGLEAALQVCDAGLECVAAGAERAALLWVRSRALTELGERREGVRCASDALRFDPSNVEAARVVAAQLGQVGNFAAAVNQLERVLDATEPPPAVRAELWEAIGRAYAGPLEDLDRAQHCYRRALEASPLRAGAREALADVTAFDPGHHRESLALHRELLAAFPSRPGSWRSLARIAEHWRRADSSRTCAIVLEALGADMEPSADAVGGRPLVAVEGSRVPSLRAASEILSAYAEAASLPSPASSAERVYAQAPEALRRELIALAGEAWELADAELSAQWLLPLGKGERAGEELPRRARRRLRAALESAQPEALRALSAGQWRAELAAQAAARAIASGELALGAALRALIAGWPETSHLRLRSNQELAAAIQSCPPVRGLLLRIADAAIAQLGL